MEGAPASAVGDAAEGWRGTGARARPLARTVANQLFPCQPPKSQMPSLAFHLDLLRVKVMGNDEEVQSFGHFVCLPEQQNLLEFAKRVRKLLKYKISIAFYFQTG